jgi:hypothetical protein
VNLGDRPATEATRLALAGQIHDRLGNTEAMHGTEIAFVDPDGPVRSRDNLKTPAIVDLCGW